MVGFRAILDWTVVGVRHAALLCAVVGALSAGHAQERFDVLHAGKNSYTNVVVTGKTPSTISISHAKGLAMVKVADLDSPTLARLGISLAPRLPATPQTVAMRPNLVMKGRDNHPTIASPADEKLATQLCVGTGVFVGGFFFLCNIIRPIMNGFLFHVGYFIFFFTGISLGGLVEGFREHGMAHLSDSWLVGSLLALLNLLALIALFRIGARTFAARAAGVRQEAKVRWTPVVSIISLTDFIQFGVYSGCYALGPVIVMVMGR